MIKRYYKLFITDRNKNICNLGKKRVRKCVKWIDMNEYSEGFLGLLAVML